MKVRPTSKGELALARPLQRHELVGATAIIITGDDRYKIASVALIRMAIEASLYTPSHGMGLSASSSKNAIAICNGSKSELAGARHLYQCKPKCAKAMQVVCLGDFDHDCFDGPYSNMLAKYMDSEVGLLTVPYAPSQGVTAVAAANLGKLRQHAEQHGCHLLVFVLPTDSPISPNAFRGLVDRTLVIKPCEPDPEHESAFSAEYVSQGMFNAKPGKMMCHVVFNQLGYPELLLEPLIHEELEARVKWHMRKQGALNKDIAFAFGTSDSTITRLLQGLPKIDKSWKTEKEVQGMLEHLTGQGRSQAKAKSQATAWTSTQQDDEEDEFDGGFWNVDDEEEDVPKKIPKSTKRR